MKSVILLQEELFQLVQDAVNEISPDFEVLYK